MPTGMTVYSHALRFACALSLTIAVIVPACADNSLTDAMVSRSQVSLGDTDRLDRVFAKALRGEPVTIGFIGGSITRGSGASAPDKNYAALLAAWWQRQFPASSIKVVNAGVNGTSSIYGALRASRDLLAHNPDFVVVEFAVNDGWQDEYAESYEGLLRQILSQPNAPAALALFMMWANGGNMQDMQAKIGRHYGLPMVSFRDAFWPEMKSGRLKWSDYIVDEVHPNDAGHEAIALFIEKLLEKHLAFDEARKTQSALAALPAPLRPTRFESTLLAEASGLNPIHNFGWVRSGRGEWTNFWTGTQPGARIAFQFSGAGIVLSYLKGRGMGKVQACIDGKQITEIDAGVETPWGLIREFRVIGAVSENSVHTIELELIGGKSADAKEFGLLSLGSIGLSRESGR